MVRRMRVADKAIQHGHVIFAVLIMLCSVAYVGMSMPTSLLHQRAQTRDTYTNPVWARDFPDPHVLYYKGKFYAYATHTGPYGFQVMESPDLVRWTHMGTAFRPPWSKVHYWAPEVVHYRGQFYMTYSAENPQNKKHDIGIAVSDSPLGPFKHAAMLVKAPEGQRGVIDTTVFFDRDGSPYLLYSEENPRGIVMRPMAADLLSVKEEKVEVVRPDREREHGVTEAPTLLLRNGVYHLFFSAGWYEGSQKASTYSVYHAKARSLRGPYVKDEESLLATVPNQTYGPGHQTVITTPAGETWMVYHGWDDQKEPRYGSNPLGRTLRIDRLHWDGDTPRMAGPTTSPRPVPTVSAVKVSIKTTEMKRRAVQRPA
jgi:beta-xylosidase